MGDSISLQRRCDSVEVKESQLGNGVRAPNHLATNLSTEKCPKMETSDSPC
jgi:hypothetical protein